MHETGRHCVKPNKIDTNITFPFICVNKRGKEKEGRNEGRGGREE
jgi:hypothetical protein